MVRISDRLAVKNISNLQIMKYLFLSLLIISGKLFSQSTLESDLEAIMEKYEAVGLSVAVVKKGELIYQKALGKKDLATNEPLRSDHIFRIASISKSFSATAVMQLVGAGKLNLQDDVSELIGFRVRHPKYPDKVITLKMLLSHTSSINDSQGYFTLDPLNPKQNPDWVKCYNDYAPGEGYQYCNLNYNLVGAIIEKYSEERFDQYVRNHVLAPLGLYGGYCVDSLDSEKFAGIYEYNAESNAYILSDGAYHPRREIIQNYLLGYTAPVFSPTGGMKISAPDLARYMTMHMKGGKLDGTRIISKKHARLIQTPVSDNGYGLALRKTNMLIPGEELIGHTGAAYGLHSSMFFHPKKKFGIVAITNGCNGCVDESWRNLMLPEVTKLLYEELVR